MGAGAEWLVKLGGSERLYRAIVAAAGRRGAGGGGGGGGRGGAVVEVLQFIDNVVFVLMQLKFQQCRV